MKRTVIFVLCLIMSSAMIATESDSQAVPATKNDQKQSELKEILKRAALIFGVGIIVSVGAVVAYAKRRPHNRPKNSVFANVGTAVPNREIKSCPVCDKQVQDKGFLHIHGACPCGKTKSWCYTSSRTEMVTGFSEYGCSCKDHFMTEWLTKKSDGSFTSIPVHLPL
jgi:hypothetical protein